MASARPQRSLVVNRLFVGRVFIARLSNLVAVAPVRRAKYLHIFCISAGSDLRSRPETTTVLRSGQKVFIVVNVSFGDAATSHDRRRKGINYRVESRSAGKFRDARALRGCNKSDTPTHNARHTRCLVSRSSARPIPHLRNPGGHHDAQAAQ
jgi:hypothetical protein